jgi:hypothetical protein
MTPNRILRRAVVATAALAALLALGTVAQASVVLSTSVVQGQPEIRNTSFKVAVSVSGNTITTATLTAVAYANSDPPPGGRLTTFTTGGNHPFAPGDSVEVVLNPANPTFDGTYTGIGSTTANTFTVYRYFATPPTLPTFNSPPPSEAIHRPYPTLGGFRLRWTPAEAISYLSVEDGALGSVFVGSVTDDGMGGRYLDISTAGNTNNTNLNPVVAIVEFQVEETLPEGTVYTVSAEDLPGFGAISLGKQKNTLTNLGANSVFFTPDFATIPHTWDNDATTSLTTTGTYVSVHDWQHLTE